MTQTWVSVEICKPVASHWLEKFEDTKRVIKSRKSNQNRHYNGEKKKRKWSTKWYNKDASPTKNRRWTHDNPRINTELWSDGKWLPWHVKIQLLYNRGKNVSAFTHIYFYKRYICSLSSTSHLIFISFDQTMNHPFAIIHYMCNNFTTLNVEINNCSLAVKQNSIYTERIALVQK